jgi:hypothetical protein
MPTDYLIRSVLDLAAHDGLIAAIIDSDEDARPPP